MGERTVYRALISTSRKESLLQIMEDLVHEGEIDNYFISELKGHDIPL